MAGFYGEFGGARARPLVWDVAFDHWWLGKRNSISRQEIESLYLDSAGSLSLCWGTICTIAYRTPLIIFFFSPKKSFFFSFLTKLFFFQGRPDPSSSRRPSKRPPPTRRHDARAPPTVDRRRSGRLATSSRGHAKPGPLRRPLRRPISPPSQPSSRRQRGHICSRFQPT